MFVDRSEVEVIIVKLKSLMKDYNRGLLTPMEYYFQSLEALTDQIPYTVREEIYDILKAKIIL